MKANLHDTQSAVQIYAISMRIGSAREWESEREFNEMFGGGEQWANMCVRYAVYRKWQQSCEFIRDVSVCVYDGCVKCTDSEANTLWPNGMRKSCICEQGYYMLTERSG